MNSSKFHAALGNQGCNQLFVYWLAAYQHGRHRHINVVLGNESLQHQRFNRLGLNRQRFFCVKFGVQLGHIHRVFNVRREVRPVAQMPPAAYHRQVHTSSTALHLHSQDVNVLVTANFHRLLVQHFGKRRHLVAQLCGLFKLQSVGVRQHLPLKASQDLLRFSL